MEHDRHGGRRPRFASKTNHGCKIGTQSSFWHAGITLCLSYSLFIVYNLITFYFYIHIACFSIRCTMLLTMFWGPLVLLRKLRELKTILQGKSNWQPTTHEMKHKNDFQWVTLEAGRLRIPGSCCDIICRLSFSLLLYLWNRRNYYTYYGPIH